MGNKGKTLGDGRKLYAKLLKIYSSPYADNKDEMIESYSLLASALQNYDEEFVIRKMYQLVKFSNGNYKSRLYSQILGSFWEKDISAEIKYKPFKAE